MAGIAFMGGLFIVLTCYHFYFGLICVFNTQSFFQALIKFLLFFYFSCQVTIFFVQLAIDLSYVFQLFDNTFVLKCKLIIYFLLNLVINKDVACKSTARWRPKLLKNFKFSETSLNFT